MACFRRDRGFCYERKAEIYRHYRYETDIFFCNGPIAFSFVVPSIIHFGAYIYAVYVFRDNNNENLSSLMERVSLCIKLLCKC